jgi:very-short-patch-repair endonuclease
MGEVRSINSKNTRIQFAKNLRKNSTLAEGILWRHLRAKKFEGLKFRRQQPLDKFIVDFINFEKRIIIELDGSQHAEETSKDIERDSALEANGFTVLRFWNNEIFENLEGVLEVIRKACQEQRRWS